MHPTQTKTSGRLIRPTAVSSRSTARHRMKSATRGLLDAANADAATLVWIIQSLYEVDGLTQAFDVALVHSLRTVFVNYLATINLNIYSFTFRKHTLYTFRLRLLATAIENNT